MPQELQANAPITFAEFIKEHPIYEFKTAPDYPRTLLKDLCEKTGEINFWKTTAVETLQDALCKKEPAVKRRFCFFSGKKNEGGLSIAIHDVCEDRDVSRADRNTEGLAEAIVNTFVKKPSNKFDNKHRVNEGLIDRVKGVLPGLVHEVLKNKPPESIKEELSKMKINDENEKYRIPRYLGSKHRDPEKAKLKDGCKGPDLSPLHLPDLPSLGSTRPSVHRCVICGSL